VRHETEQFSGKQKQGMSRGSTATVWVYLPFYWVSELKKERKRKKKKKRKEKKERDSGDSQWS